MQKFSSLAAVFETLRTPPATNSLKGIDYKIDRTPRANYRVTSLWVNRNGDHVELELSNDRELLYFKASSILSDLLRLESEATKKAFHAHYIGIRDPSSFTGNYYPIDKKTLAKFFKFNYHTLRKKLSKLRDLFESELTAKGLI